VQELCHFASPELASGLAAYLTYCNNLGFQERPDYAYLRNVFSDIFVQCGFGCARRRWDARMF
jgi:hypothetical protein